MKRLSIYFLVGLFVLTSAFAPVDKPVYPGLMQSFKTIKKSNPITYDRQDVIGGIQQLGIVLKGKKQKVMVEFLGNDGFSGQIAKAVFQTALASYGINDVEFSVVDPAVSAKVAATLTKFGYKVSGNEAEYNNRGDKINFTNSLSNPHAIHVLVQESAASLLTSPDKFAVKLYYPSINDGASDVQFDTQSKLIASEMIFAASRFKENWK